MKHFKKFSILVLLILIESIYLAPVDLDKNFYDTIKSDKRFEKLLQLKFVKECENENGNNNLPICSALVDIALRFEHNAKLDFAKTAIKNDENFCSSQLLKSLPDEPTQDTSTLMKSYNITWFKDILKQNNGKMCNDECTYQSYDDYARKVKPVCFFIYDQYSYLASQKIKSSSANTTEQNQNKAVAATKPKTSSPQLTRFSIPSEAGSIIEAIPAKIEVKSDNKSLVQAENPQEQLEQLHSVKDTKIGDVGIPAIAPEVSTATAALLNKSESSGKTDTNVNPVNIDEEQNLENSLPDTGVFDETQTPDKDQDINMEIGGDLGDDEDENYPDDLARDNNRNEPVNNNKFPQEPANNEVEGAEGDDSVSQKHYVPFQEGPDSNFFTYLCIIMFLSILLYILYHNRQKILALLLEGRRGSRRSRERSRGGSKAAYSKLDCNLEEAITSKKTLSSTSNIIY